MAIGNRAFLRSVVQFRLLGGIEAEVNGRYADLGGPREQRLLTALLSVVGQPLSHEELIDWIWDAPPKEPGHALAEIADTLRTGRLRPIGLGDALIGGDGVYRLDIPAEWVDVHQFRILTERAAQLDDVEGREFLAAALQSVRGIPLADLDGRRIAEYRHELAEELHAAQTRFTRIQIGQSRSATTRHPEIAQAL
ncbi:hypothetical protein [Nocardia sp. NPDC005366]|uniref:AfsR/SARP family transcriptional regulator n=1 Tax=Nocardia sp. NPDC005366 TaxID=3156878 RepID=UPI0033A9E22F